jgi:hypothetical protein
MYDDDTFHGTINFPDGLTGEDVEQIGTYLVGPDKTGNALSYDMPKYAIREPTPTEAVFDWEGKINARR